MTDPGIALEEVRGRLDRTRRMTAERGLDGLVVIGRAFYDRPGDLAYLTNHFPPFPASVFSTVQKGLGHGLLLLPVRGAPALIIDGWAYRKDMMVIEDIRADSDLGRGLVGALQERGLATARIGLVGEDILPLALYREITGALPGLVVEPADDLVRSQRTIKSASEQALLRRAAEVAHTGLRAAVERIREGSGRAPCARRASGRRWTRGPTSSGTCGCIPGRTAPTGRGGPRPPLADWNGGIS